jgi:MYXO-CTERM domain-containing protein
MKKMLRILIASFFCLAFAGGSNRLIAQDASHMETAKAEDSSDWGLLGLIGLLGLLGLRRRPRTDITVDPNR